MAKTRQELLLEQIRKKYGTQQTKQVEEPKDDTTVKNEGGLLSSIKDYFGEKVEERKNWKENIEEQDLSWLAKNQGKNMQIGQQLAQTFYNTLENVVDTGADILAKGANAVGWDGVSKNLTDFSNINLTEEITGSDAFKLAQQLGLIKLGGSAYSNPTGFVPGMVKNYASSLIAGDQDKVFEMAHNKEMLPPIATDVVDSLSSMVVMGTLGQGNIPAIMALSGTGAFQESYDNGGTFGESLAYGTTSGIVEGMAEKFVGDWLEKIGLGNNKVGGIFGGSKSGSVVKDFIKSFNEEGMEELVSQSVSPWLKKLTFKNEKDIATIYKEDGGVEALFEAYMLGGLSGGIGGASSSISNISKYGVEGKNAFKNLEDAKETFGKLVKLDKSGNLTDERIAKHNIKLQEHLNEYLKNMELLKQKYGKDSSQYKNTLSETGRMAIDLDTMTANDVNIANEINESKAKIKSYHSYIPQEYQAEIKKILGDKATESDLNSNAYITSDGRILVNRGSKAYKQGRLYNVVGHEIIHTIENTPEYAKMLKDYNDNLTPEEKQATINKYRKAYGQQMTDEQIMNEMFADYVGKNVATNYKEFKRMLGNKQSFWSKLIDAVKGYKGIVHEGARKLQSDVANAINKSTGNMQTAKASKDVNHISDKKMESLYKINEFVISNAYKINQETETKINEELDSIDSIARISINKDGTKVRIRLGEQFERECTPIQLADTIKLLDSYEKVIMEVLDQNIPNQLSEFIENRKDKVQYKGKDNYEMLHYAVESVIGVGFETEQNYCDTVVTRGDGNLYVDIYDIDKYLFSIKMNEEDNHERKQTNEESDKLRLREKQRWCSDESARRIVEEFYTTQFEPTDERRTNPYQEITKGIVFEDFLKFVSKQEVRLDERVQVVPKEYYTKFMRDISEENQKIRGIKTEFIIDAQHFAGYYRDNTIGLCISDWNTVVEINRHEKIHFLYDTLDYDLDVVLTHYRNKVLNYLHKNNEYDEMYKKAEDLYYDYYNGDKERIEEEMFAMIYGIGDIHPEFKFKNYDYQELVNEELTEELSEVVGFRVKFSKDVEVDSQGNALSEEQVEHFKDVHEELRDEYGNLKVLYHGTQQGGFTIFNTKAVFLTDSLDVSKTYSKSDNIGYKDKKTNYKVYANVKNPFVIDCNGGHWSKIETDINDFIGKQFTDAITSRNQKQIMAFIENNLKYDLKMNYTKENSNKIKFENGYIELDNNKIYTNKGSYSNYKEFYKGYLGKKTYTSTDEILGKILFDPKYSNYDGIVFKNVVDTGGTYKGVGDTAQSNVYVAFEPNQIKDINNQNPTSNPDIRYSKDVDSLWDDEEQQRISEKVEYNLDEYKTVEELKKVTNEIVERLDAIESGHEPNSDNRTKSLQNLYNAVKTSKNQDDFDRFKERVELFEHYHKLAMAGAKKGQSLEKGFLKKLSKSFNDNMLKGNKEISFYKNTLNLQKKNVEELESIIVQQDESAIELDNVKKELTARQDRIETKFQSVPKGDIKKDGKDYSLYLRDKINNLKSVDDKRDMMREIDEYSKLLEAENNIRTGLADIYKKADTYIDKINELAKYDVTTVTSKGRFTAEQRINALNQELKDLKLEFSKVKNITDKESANNLITNLEYKYRKFKEENYEDYFKMSKRDTDKLMKEKYSSQDDRVDKVIKEVYFKGERRKFSHLVEYNTANEKRYEHITKIDEALQELLTIEYEVGADLDKYDKLRGKINNTRLSLKEDKVKLEEVIAEKIRDEQLKVLEKEQKAKKELEDIPAIDDKKAIVELIEETRPEAVVEEQLVDNTPAEVENVVTQEDEVLEKTEKSAEKPIEKQKKVEKKDKTPKNKVEKTSEAEVKTKVISNSKQLIKRDLAKNVKGEADQTQLVKYTQTCAENMIKVIKTALAGNNKFPTRLIYNGEGVKVKIADVFEAMNSEGTIQEKVDKIYDMLKDGIEIKIRSYAPGTKRTLSSHEVYTSITDGRNPYVGTSVEKHIVNTVKMAIETALNTDAKPTTLAKKLAELTYKLQNEVNELTALMDMYEQERNSLRQELLDLKTDMSKANNNADLSKFEAEIEKTKKSIESLEGKYNKLTRKSEVLKEENIELKNMNKALKVDYKKMKNKLTSEANKRAKAEAQLQTYEFNKTTQDSINKFVRDEFELEGWKINEDTDFMNSFADVYSKGEIVKANDLLLDKILNTTVKDGEGNDIEYKEYLELSESDIDLLRSEMILNLIATAENGKQTEMVKWKEKLAKVKEQAKVNEKLEKKIRALKRELGYDLKVVTNKGGGVDPDYVSSNLSLINTLKHLSARDIRKGKVREVLLKFLSDYKNVLDDLPIKLNDELYNKIEELTLKTDDVTVEEIKEYKDVMNGLKKFFKDVRHDRSAVINGVKYKVSDLTHQGIEESQKISEKVKGEELIMNLSDAQDPIVVFRRCDGYQDGVWTKLYEMLAEGTIEYQKAYMDLYNPFQEFYAKHKKFRKGLKKKVTIKGYTTTINKMLYAYETLTDADSMQHALAEGLVFNGEVLKFKNEEEVNEFKKEIEEHFKLNEENEYSEYVKLIDNWGIENAKIKKAVDEKVKGYTNIKGDKYFGFEIDDRHFAQEIGGDPLRSNESLALKEQRFNKNRTKNGAPLKIQDIDTTIEIRSNAMAMYHGYGERLELFNYILNAKYENGISLMKVTRERFGRNKGKRGYKLDDYMNKLANDLQGRINDSESKILRKIRSGYSTFVLGLNLQTGIKQFGAIINATKHIKARYMFRPGKIDNVPLPTSAKYRQFRDSYITAEGQVEHQKGGLNDIVMFFTKKADELSVRIIWRGALYQTRNSDGSFNLVEAEKLFEKTMRETQVTNNPLDRSALLRSQKDLVKSFTMFSSEPSKQFSNLTESAEQMYYNAIVNGKVQAKDVKKLFGATSRALASATFSVLVSQLFRWWREKDDEEDKLEYMLQKLANEMLDIIPVFGNIANIDTSRPIPISFDTDLNALGDVLSTFNDISSSPSLDEFVRLIAQIFGIPIDNVKTSIFTTMKKVGDGVDKGFGAHMKEWVYQQEAKVDGKTFSNKEPINSALKVGRDKKAKAYYNSYTDNIMKTSNDVKDELFRLYSSAYSKETGVTTSGAFLKPIPDTITYNNEVIIVDKDVFELYYSEVNKQLEKAIKSISYNKLSDEQKDKAISMLINSYYSIAKKSHTGEELNNTETLLFTGYNNFSTIAPHLAYIKSISSDDKCSRKKLVQKYINQQVNMTRGQKYLIYYLAGYSLNDDNKKLVEKHLKSKGVSPKEIKLLFPDSLEDGDDW